MSTLSIYLSNHSVSMTIGGSPDGFTVNPILVEFCLIDECVEWSLDGKVFCQQDNTACNIQWFPRLLSTQI